MSFQLDRRALLGALAATANDAQGAFVAVSTHDLMVARIGKLQHDVQLVVLDDQHRLRHDALSPARATLILSRAAAREKGR